MKAQDKKAIEALERQKEKLNDKATFDFGNTWTVQTIELIKTYFGENSQFYKASFDNKIKTQIFPNSMTPEKEEQFIRLTKMSAISLINSCIEHIEANGVYKEPKLNWIYSIKGEYVNILIVVILPSIFVFGMWFNSFQSNTANINALQKRIETLNDSIRSLSNPANNNFETPNNPKK